MGDGQRRRHRATVWLSGRVRDGHGDGLLHSGRASRGQIWPASVRDDYICFLHVVSRDAALGAQFRLAGTGVCRARIEGVWRTGAQGADHRRGETGTTCPDLRRVLFDPRLRGDDGIVSRRVAVEHRAAREFHWRGGVRRAGDDLVLVVYFPPGKISLLRSTACDFEKSHVQKQRNIPTGMKKVPGL